MLTACRHLISRGVHVVVVLTTIEAKQIPESAEEIKILKEIGAGIMERDEFKPNMFSSFDLILDGMIGYQLSGKLRPNVARLCTYINEKKLPVVSNDIPSGFHPDKGHINEGSVHATYTLSIALPKPALLDNSWKGVYGHLYLGNIGVPPHLYRQMKIDVPEDLFGERNIIPLVKSQLLVLGSKAVSHAAVLWVLGYPFRQSFRVNQFQLIGKWPTLEHR